VKTLPVLYLLLASTVLGDTLAVQTSAPPVGIRPGDNGFVALPAVAIDTVISATCADGATPVSLTLSSADSVLKVGPGEFTGDQLRLVFTLPAAQLPPLNARGLCTSPAAGIATPVSTQQSKPAFVSLYVSLRCNDGAAERLTTRTAVVDLTLECEGGGDDPAADQGASE
jgi:hypothetical protein